MLCNKLKEIRISHNLSPNQMAIKMNVTRNTVKNYEDGKTSPDIFYIKKICEEFNVDLETLVYSEKEKTFKHNGTDADSYEFEGTFIQLIQNCQNKQEASLIYDIFLSLVYSLLHMQTSFNIDSDFIEESIELFHEKNIDFYYAYRTLSPHLDKFSKQAKLKELTEKIDNLCTYYSKNSKVVFDDAFDHSYGTHELD